jgi:hypothetical protein
MQEHCHAVQFDTSSPTFRRNLLAALSVLKSKPSKQTYSLTMKMDAIWSSEIFVRVYHTIRCHIPKIVNSLATSIPAEQHLPSVSYNNSHPNTMLHPVSRTHRWDVYILNIWSKESNKYWTRILQAEKRKVAYSCRIMNESTEISRYSQNKLCIINIKGHKCPPEQDCVTSCDIIHCSGAIREAVPETLHNTRRASRVLGFTRYFDLHIIGCNYGLLTSYEFVKTTEHFETDLW